MAGRRIATADVFALTTNVEMQVAARGPRPARRSVAADSKVSVIALPLARVRVVERRTYSPSKGDDLLAVKTYARPRSERGGMDTALILLEGAVVILAILLGVRTGGIGLGLWGLVGMAVLVFVFHLPPGDPPTSSMFIILMVITAASTMQSVGGIDYLVEVAKKILKRNPAYIAIIAPFVAFVFTLGAGTGFIYYSLIPVIYAVSYFNKVRPERPLAVAGTASQFAITASPVSAAMATLVGLLDPVGFGIGDILIIVLP